MIIRTAAQWQSVYKMLDAYRRTTETVFPASGVEVTWREAVATRTGKQNSYYWDVVTPMVADHLTEKHQFPYTKEMAHDLLKSEFLPPHFHRTCPVTGRVFYGSTTNLKKSGDEDSWQEYITKIQAWAAKSGCYIPDPNEEPPR